MCTVFPTNKTTHAIHPNETNCPHTIYPKRHQPSTRNPSKRNRRGGACVPARTSAQRRFHTKNTRIVRGILTMDAPLWGDTGGHTGTAPTHLHQTTRCAITLYIPWPPHRIVHSIAPNHAVCHYPIGVVLSIAQGRQVQRSLPWVTMQARRLPHWGLYFFSSRIITTQCRMNGFPHAN